MKVKICGITNLQDALTAVELGADALGFIFVRTSQRYIAPNVAQRIICELPPFIVPVGVFVDMTYNEIFSIINQAGICCVQLHGNEPPERTLGFPVPIIKSFRVNSDFNVEILSRYNAAAYLLDTQVDGVLGGTGKTFDWSYAVAAKAYGRIILAGGLTPENIVEAAQTVQPYAIDINSGVESAPGKKDKTKLSQLFENLQQLQSK
jgi:phosphoribosylanthranilate isomerase